MSRVAPLDPATLTPEQQRVAADIAGARKSVRGPFTIWLRNPALAEHANAFGVALRDSKVLVGGVNVEEYVQAWRARRIAR